MPLISCPECGRSISDKAKSCPSCGLPMADETLAGRLSQGASSAVRAVSKHLNDPVETVGLAELLNDVRKIPSDFSAGETINGTGTSIGGYVGIPGIPGLGIVRKCFCVFFIPLIPLGLYLVKDWDGTGGVFLGQISSDKAAKYVNIRKQALATIIGGIGMLIAFMIALCVLAFILEMIW
jgi:hypothetical protein